MKTTKRSPKPRFSGSLPDGSITTSIEQYSEAWRSFAQPFVAEFGWQPYGYEPGISFAVGHNGGALTPSNTPGSGTFHLPLGIARRLYALIVENHRFRGSVRRSVGNLSLDDVLIALSAECPNDGLLIAIDERLRVAGWQLNPYMTKPKRSPTKKRK